MSSCSAHSRALILLVFAVAAQAALAETDDADAATVLFVSSAPIGAEVSFDGSSVGRTPLLLTDIPAGGHVIEVFKPGFLTGRRRVSTSAGEIGEVELALEPSAFVAQFSAPELITPAARYARDEATVSINSGTYTLSSSGTALKIEPHYPLEPLRRAAIISTPILVAVTTLALVEDLLAPRSASFHPAPSTIAAFGLTTTTFGFAIGLSRDRNRYLQRATVGGFSGIITAAEAQAEYVAGDAALEAGNLAAALEHYSRLLAAGTDSELLPDALYKAARVYAISGESGLALPLLEQLVDRYPVIDYYDAALVQIADFHVEAARYDAARDAIGRMVFADPLFPRAEIADYLRRIDELDAGGER